MDEPIWILVLGLIGFAMIAGGICIKDCNDSKVAITCIQAGGKWEKGSCTR